MTAMLYQPRRRWRFGVAFGLAVVIHFAAIAFANVRNSRSALPAATSGFTELSFIETPTPEIPVENNSEPSATPPIIDDTYIEDTFTLPRQKPTGNSRPLVRARSTGASRSLNLSSARVLALNAPRPEYPYEARRQKITGDGIVTMTIDPVSGHVIEVTMSKSTGSAFLDNAALGGFKRWRFKPGTVSSVTCPVTFTLSGVSY